MIITLRPEHEQLIEDAMQTGAYQDPDDVVGRALEMLHSEDLWLKGQKSSIRTKIDRAFDQFERGEFLSAEESRAEMEKRKDVWQAERHRG